MDLEIVNENQRLKVRANGIIINNGKVLLCKIKQNTFWCLPGGHIHLMEDSKTAVLREISEEVCIDFEDAKLCTVMENFFISRTGKEYHEIDFFYLMSGGEIPPEKLVDYDFLENDEGKMVHLYFKWFDLAKLDEFDIRPQDIKQILATQNFKLSHIIKDER